MTYQDIFQTHLNYFWSQNLKNSEKIELKLTNLFAFVNEQEDSILEFLDENFEDLLKSKIRFAFENVRLIIDFLDDDIKSININFNALYKAYKQLDFENYDSILDLIYEVKTIALEVFSNTFKGDIDKIKEILNLLEKTLHSIIALIQIDNLSTPAEVMAMLQKVKQVIDALIENLYEADIINTELFQIQEGVNHVFEMLSYIILKNYKKEEDSEEEKIDINSEKETALNILDFSDAQEIFKVEEPFRAQQIIENINTNFDKIINESHKLPILNSFSYKETELKEIWEFLLSLLNPFDEDIFTELEYVLDALQEKSDVLFAFILKKSSDSIHLTELIEDQIQPKVNQWLTLPQGFKPNNIIEVIHQIVKNILFSLESSKYSSAVSVIYNGLEKLEYILNSIDNDSFKLLITPKHDVTIHEIDLPNLIEDELIASERIDKKEKKTEVNFKELDLSNRAENELITTELKDKEEKKTEVNFKELDQAITPTKLDQLEGVDSTTDSKPLTIASFIELLCFSETYGATAKLHKKHQEVIKDLYNRVWLSNKLEDLEYDFTSIFNLEKLNIFGEEIKNKLLDKDGINLGAFLTYIIDSILGVLDEGLNLFKEALEYYIDEIFTLIKALITFLNDVEFPVQKLPKFMRDVFIDKNGKEFNMLHTLLAIPYTIVKEFKDFKIPTTETAV